MTDFGFTDSCGISDESEELNYFLEFIDPNLVDMIVLETNRYYEYLKSTLPPFSPRSRLARLKNVTRDEIYVFLCIVQLMAHVRKHRINDYWTIDEIFQVKTFATLMSRDRFLQILRALHFTVQ